MDRFGLDSQIITQRRIPGCATMGITSAKELEAQGQKKLDDVKEQGKRELGKALGPQGEAYVELAEKSFDKLKEGDLGGASVDILLSGAAAIGDPVVLPFMIGVYASAVDTVKETEKQVVNFLNNVQKQAVGYVKDLFDENVCEKGQDSAGKALNACHDRITKLLGYTGSNESICSFRLGEAIAKADKRVAQQKWVYARYVENGKVPAGIRNAAGTKDKTRRGFKDRWRHFPGTNEVGPCGLRNIIGHALKTSIALEKTLEVSKNVDDRRLIFLSFLCMWLPGGRFDAKTGKATNGWCLGMDFLIRDALKAPSLDAYLKKQEASGLTGISQDTARAVADDNIKKKEEAERRAKLDAKISALNSVRLASEQQKAILEQQRAALEQQKASLTAKKSGPGGIVALAAAAAGVYFLTKG